ncbi:MAG: methyl-accepting chemotaxis protein [Opitutales bacterium]|nr:methyl-accepting chemotaxis protein [Opitutales bacterium]
MKIRTKIILYILLPIFVVDLAITATNSYNNYLELKSVAESKFVSETELISAKISAENTRGVALAKSTAESASILFGERAESVRLVKDILTEFPSFIGASVGYEVNADFADFKTELGLKNLRDGKDVKTDGGVDAYNFSQNKTNVSMDEWIAKSEGGRFIAYWTRAKGELVLEPLTGMDTAMYSAGLRKKTESGDGEAFIVTEPYMYSNNIMMVEYSAPIFYEGKFCGQVAFDRDLSTISSLINSVKTSRGGDIFLVSAQGRIITATKNENLRTLSIDDLLTDENGNFTLATLRDENGQLIRDEMNVAKNDISKYRTAYRDMLKTAFETSKNSIMIENLDKGVSTFRDAQTDKVYWVSHNLVRPGNWVVVNVVSQDEILSTIYSSIVRDFAGMGVYLFVLLVSLFAMRGTFYRIKQSADIAEKVSVGNFRIETNATETSSDEAGRLLHSVAKMTSKVRSFVLHIKIASLGISESAEEIEYSSGKYASGLKETNGQIESVADSLKQLGENSRILCDLTDELSENALDGAQKANDGKRKISEMELALGVFSRSTSSVGRRLATISERVENIASSVATVAKVSEETNLLSLNASIEAEKAGSAGVGFAVVAREIGRLAEQSASAVEDIETIVKDMQSAVESGVAEMDKFAEEIRTGGADVARLILDIDELASKMQTIAPQVERLASAMQSQRFDISKLADTISDVGDSMKQTALYLRDAENGRLQLKEASSRLSSEISAFDVESKGND